MLNFFFFFLKNFVLKCFKNFYILHVTHLLLWQKRQLKTVSSFGRGLRLGALADDFLFPIY